MDWKGLKNLPRPGDVATITKTLETPINAVPTTISSSNAKDTIKLLMWEKEYEVYLEQKETLVDNLQNLFAVI